SGVHRQSCQSARHYSLATNNRGCARYRTKPDTSRHELKTTMQHLVICPKQYLFPNTPNYIYALVSFLAYHRIKPHAPPLVRAPVNSFEFQSCDRTPQVGYLSLSLSHSSLRPNS